MSQVTVETRATVDITPRKLAEWFCEMNDEQQSEFFAQCKRVGDEFDAKTRAARDKGYRPLTFGMDYQFMAIGELIRGSPYRYPLPDDIRQDAEHVLMHMAASLYLHADPEMEWRPRGGWK